MVRVLLDATAVPTDRGGVGRYVDNLVPALARQDIELLVACRHHDAQYYGDLSGRDPLVAPVAVQSVPRRLIWEQTGFLRVIQRAAPDVVHCPHYTQPLLARRPLVITVHDATFFTDRDAHLRIKGPFFRTATRLAARRARCCVVPSQATADELVRVAGADPTRLRVAHHGVDSRVFSPPAAREVAALRARLGIAEGDAYIAFLGTLEPRKNVPALVRGWTAAFRGRDRPPVLVLAGGEGWDDQVAAAIAEVPAGLRLVRTGYLPQQELAALLGGASLVAYPSRNEGFGLPVLEAMACGAAVLTTRHTALPEIGGDAVAYTQTDPQSIGMALAELLDDPDRRADLAAAGLRRAAQFTWDACAQSHIAAYEFALQGAQRSG